MHASFCTGKIRAPGDLVTRVFSAGPLVSSMLGGQVRRRYPRKRPPGGLRPVGDQNHGPLSGWLAERRLKKALPSSQRRRRDVQGRRPVGDSPPRPSERQRPDDSLPPPDFVLPPQTEPAPDHLPTAADESPEARQTADTKAEAAPGDERAEAASSLVNGGDGAARQASWEAEPQVAPPPAEGEPSAAQGEPLAESLADQPPATADQAARSAAPAAAAVAPVPAAPAPPAPDDTRAAAAPQPDESAGETARIEAEPEAAGQAGSPEVPAQRPGSARTGE